MLESMFELIEYEGHLRSSRGQAIRVGQSWTCSGYCISVSGN